MRSPTDMRTRRLPRMPRPLGPGFEDESDGLEGGAGRSPVGLGGGYGDSRSGSGTGGQSSDGRFGAGDVGRTASEERRTDRRAVPTAAQRAAEQCTRQQTRSLHVELAQYVLDRATETARARARSPMVFTPRLSAADLAALVGRQMQHFFNTSALPSYVNDQVRRTLNKRFRNLLQSVGASIPD